MKRQYPLFIIDREIYDTPYSHYISCVDDECPFVIRVRIVEELPAEHAGLYELKGPLLFEVVKLNDDADLGRVRSLFKKAIKKYMVAFSHRNYADKELGLDNQIYQQELTIARAKRRYSDLLEQADGKKELADFAIRLAEATLGSLQELKEIREGGN